MRNLAGTRGFKSSAVLVRVSLSQSPVHVKCSTTRIIPDSPLREITCTWFILSHCADLMKSMSSLDDRQCLETLNTLYRNSIGPPIAYRASRTPVDTRPYCLGHSIIIGQPACKVKALSQALVTLKANPETFGALKEELLRNLRNQHLDTATHADYVRLSVLVDGKFAIEDVIAELEHVTEADIEAHRTHALSDAHLEALIAGNMTASETRDLARCEIFPVSKICIYVSCKCK